MKKIFSLILAVGLTYCCTACSGSSPSSSSTEKVSQDFLQEWENCISKDYPNLDFSSCLGARAPESDEYYRIEIQSDVDMWAGMSNKELLDRFEEYCRRYIGEYDTDCMFVSAYELPYVDDFYDSNGILYRGRNKISDHRESIENEEVNMYDLEYLNIETHQYLWWDDSMAVPHWINRGAAYELLNDPSIRVSSWIPSDIGAPDAVYFNDGTYNDEKYMLSDGELSISEAIEYFTNEYFSSYAEPPGEKYTFKVRTVEVYELSDGIYCYNIIYTPAWDLIPFEFMGEYYSHGDTPHIFSKNCQALMVRRNDIDVIIDPYFQPTEEIGEPLTDIISVEAVMDIVSSSLSQSVVFEVITADLIYHGEYADDNKTAQLTPTWCIELLNTNDDLSYRLYIDAVSGKCSYFTYTPI